MVNRTGDRFTNCGTFVECVMSIAETASPIPYLAAAAPTRHQLRWLSLDAAMGALVVVWTAEALVRLPMLSAVTALVYAYFSLRFAMTLPRFLPLVLRNWPVLLYPGLCLASVAWSLTPMLSMVGAVQILFTILIGVFLGGQLGLRGLALLILCALGVTMLASLANLGGAFGKAWSYFGGFLGIYTNKNALGQRGVLLLVTCLFFVLTERRGPVFWLALALGALTMVLLGLSLSVTSILMSAAMGGLTLLVLGWVNLPHFRGLAVIFVTLSGAAMAVSLIILGINPVTEVLDAFGKNATLTGRTVLWEVGLAKVGEAPLFGHGILAFWHAPEFAQEVLVISGLYGETVEAFHNFVIEALVALGPLGLVTLLAIAAHAVIGLGRVPAGQVRYWGWLVVLLLLLLSLLGSSFFRQHEISLLLVVAIGAAAHRDGRAGPVRRVVRRSGTRPRPGGP